MYHQKKVTALALSLGALVALGACGRKDEPAVADTTAMAPPAPAPAAMRVTAVETGKGINADKTLRDDDRDFGVRDTVYVSVKTEGAGSGTLGAKFTFQDGQVVEQTSQSIAPTGDAFHEFHIQKATAWPKGDYRVVITLNGDSVGTKEFTVK
jgi:hypothetical protein